MMRRKEQKVTKTRPNLVRIYRSHLSKHALYQLNLLAQVRLPSETSEASLVEKEDREPTQAIDKPVPSKY